MDVTFREDEGYFKSNPPPLQGKNINPKVQEEVSVQWTDIPVDLRVEGGETNDDLRAGGGEVADDFYNLANFDKPRQEEDLGNIDRQKGLHSPGKV